MGKWMSWLHGLGDAIVHAATTLLRSKTVAPNGVVDTGATCIGFLIAEAMNMDAAIEIE
jgi:hypothetical protein